MTINLSQLTGDEKLFLSRIADLFEISGSKCITKFTGFLDGRQANIASEYARQNHFNSCLFHGGYENAERLVLGVFPPDKEPDVSVFPITPVTASYPAGFKLSHRDFLGSLMALNISRESVGDILAGEGRCDFFVLTPVSRIIFDELDKVGNVGVKIAARVPGDFVVADKFEALRGTVSSARLDSLISLLTRLPREKSSALIRQGLVKHNFAVSKDGARKFSAGDTVSIRGFGRFSVDEIGAPTKKDRLPVFYRKYI